MRFKLISNVGKQRRKYQVKRQNGQKEGWGTLRNFIMLFTLWTLAELFYLASQFLPQPSESYKGKFSVFVLLIGSIWPSGSSLLLGILFLASRTLDLWLFILSLVFSFFLISLTSNCWSAPNFSSWTSSLFYLNLLLWWFYLVRIIVSVL